MTNRERELATLNFGKPEGRGTVAETFYPWDLTRERFREEGLPDDIVDRLCDITNEQTDHKEKQMEKYLEAAWGNGIMEYETYLGFDPVRRIHFALPFRRVEATIESLQDWERLKVLAEQEVELYFTEQRIKEVYGALIEGHERGEYSIRLNIEGFFWVPRELMGIEAHMLAFYDEPELLHAINDYTLHIYMTKLMEVIRFVKPDLVYIMEDLSGKTGPMISPDCFNEFIGDYYRQLIPLLKQNGVSNVFVDTDGDFAQLIPHFIEAGVDGFLPMDVNAGMDIVEVRRQFPGLKFIGSFNKLEIAKGPQFIDREFQRILPVIRGGGYIPGADHQVDPSTSLENYKYYIKKLTKIMEQSGADLE